MLAQGVGCASAVMIPIRHYTRQRRTGGEPDAENKRTGSNAWSTGAPVGRKRYTSA
jgi:hypothetical protein